MFELDVYRKSDEREAFDRWEQQRARQEKEKARLAELTVDRWRERRVADHLFWVGLTREALKARDGFALSEGDQRAYEGLLRQGELLLRNARVVRIGEAAGVRDTCDMEADEAPKLTAPLTLVHSRTSAVTACA